MSLQGYLDSESWGQKTSLRWSSNRRITSVRLQQWQKLCDRWSDAIGSDVPKEETELMSVTYACGKSEGNGQRGSESTPPLTARVRVLLYVLNSESFTCEPRSHARDASEISRAWLFVWSYRMSCFYSLHSRWSSPSIPMNLPVLRRLLLFTR